MTPNLLLLSPRFTDALTFATELHTLQTRKGTEGIGGVGTPAIPYIAHLLSVCALVLEHGGTETEAIAALLHDSVEDQGGPPRLQQVAARFGDKVAAIVEACTDGPRERGADGTPAPSWRERKQTYVRHLPDEPADVLLVSAADKRHNAQAILDDLRAAKRHGEPDAATVAEAALWVRFKPGRASTLRYYEALAAAYNRAPAVQNHPGLRRLVDEFAATVAELGREAGANDEPPWSFD